MPTEPLPSCLTSPNLEGHLLHPRVDNAQCGSPKICSKNRSSGGSSKHAKIWMHHGTSVNSSHLHSKHEGASLVPRMGDSHGGPITREIPTQASSTSNPSSYSEMPPLLPRIPNPDSGSFWISNSSMGTPAKHTARALGLSEDSMNAHPTRSRRGSLFCSWMQALILARESMDND